MSKKKNGNIQIEINFVIEAAGFDSFILSIHQYYLPCDQTAFILTLQSHRKTILVPFYIIICISIASLFLFFLLRTLNFIIFKWIKEKKKNCTMQ